MTKLYVPRVTVTFRREFDGKIEREHTLSLVGEPAQHLEAAVASLLYLAGQTPAPLHVPTPAEPR